MNPLNLPQTRRDFLLNAGKSAGLAFLASTLSTRSLFADDMSAVGSGKGWGRGPLSGLPWHSGGYKMRGGADAWRGRPLDVSQGFTMKTSWKEIEDTGIKQLSWGRNIPEMMSISLAICTNDDSPKVKGPQWWKDAADGKMDDQWTRICEGIKERFQSKLILRPAWELNHKGFPWYMGVCENPKQRQWFKDAWKRLVDVTRKVLGDKIIIDWCIVHESSFTWCNVTEFYPGNDHVDVIGIDYYDWWPSNKDQAAWDRNILNDGKRTGIKTWLDFAKSNGKPMSIPEWGVMNRDDKKNKPKNQDKPTDQGGDNPFYIDKMFDFFKSNASDIAYECYFNSQGTALRHVIYPAKDCSVPNTAKRYQERWSA